MSKDIIIQESGEPKTLSSIDKIITPKVGGGSAEWVLFENLDLMEKTITKNGTYKAEDDNVYGYHKVTVKVPKKGKKKTGKRPQSSGDPNDYCVTTEDDGQGGQNLVYTKLPTSINIINPPSKTVYDDNELIKKDGMLVRAYYADGGLWGDVPLGETSLDPDRASASGSGGATYVTDGNGLNAICIPITLQYYYRYNYDRDPIPVWGTPYFHNNSAGGFIGRGALGHYVSEYQSDAWTKVYLTQFRGSMWGATDVNGAYIQNLKELEQGASFVVVTGGAGAFGRTFSDGMRFVVSIDSCWIDIPESTVSPKDKTIDNMTEYGSIQDITVKWPRPEDGKILTDTFEVKTTVHQSSGNNNSGNTGGNNTGGGS